MRLQFSRKNIYGHTAVVAPLRLRLTVQIQKLNTNRNHQNTNHWNTNLLCNEKKVFLFFSGKLVCS